MTASVLPCGPDLVRLFGELGLACEDAGSLVGIRNPLALANWTLPVVESLMVIGAVLALALAVRRVHRDGDPTTLTLWVASVVHVLVFEVALALPGVFDVTDSAGTLFAHNVFTVELAYDRVPLYVVAMYPALVTLAFDIVRAVGVFERRGALVGAICVGFTSMCFYEIFDHLGPQSRWWAWNTVNPVNRPMVDSVPMAAMVIFAMAAPTVLALLAYVWVGAPAARGRRFGAGETAWRTAAVAAVATAVTAALGLLTARGAGGSAPAAVLLAVTVVAFAAVTVPAMFQQWRRMRRVGSTYPSTYAKGYGALYLIVFAVLWVCALPELAGAIGGMTSAGTPIGNFATVAACFTFALAGVAGVWTVDRRDRRPRVGAATAAQDT